MRTKFVSRLKNKDLTISIVSYNTKDLLKRCLNSVFKYTRGLSFEVIVVDNASADGSVEMVKKHFKSVKLIVNQTNNFYTGANNQALTLAQGKYFLILNSDIYLQANSFKSMVAYLEKNPQVGAVEPLQYDKLGKVSATGSRHNSFFHDLIELTILHRIFKPKDSADFYLQSLNRRRTWPADVISDAAFMLKTEIFRKINGYDAKFKLYYTENDLCHRLQSLGLTTVHYAPAIVWHTISASTDKAGWPAISKIYAADALAYYSKYHSWLSAGSLFLAMKLSNFIVLIKKNWQLALILLLALLLRFYRLGELMAFIGDQGRDYLAARDMILTGHWPLVGIPSSVPWLHQGPVFIWLIALALKISHFNPLGPAQMTGLFGVLAVYLVYRFSRSYLAALVMATAPLAVVHSRLAYHISPIPLFTLLYLITMKTKSKGWSFFLAAVLLQLELTTLPLTILSMIFFRSFSVFWLIPFIPKIIYDLSHGFTQTLGFGAWAGYRLLNVFHYGNAVPAIWEYWTKFSAWGYPVLAALMALVLILSLPRQSKLLLSVLGFTLLSFFIHGAPSEAYFPVLFPVWAIMLGTLKNRVFQTLIALICLLNIYSLFSHNFYPYGTILSKRITYVKLILAKKEPFYLKNPKEVIFASFLDNYRYLIWWQGGQEDASADTAYTFFQ